MSTTMIGPTWLLANAQDEIWLFVKMRVNQNMNMIHRNPLWLHTWYPMILVQLYSCIQISLHVVPSSIYCPYCEHSNCQSEFRSSEDIKIFWKEARARTTEYAYVGSSTSKLSQISVLSAVGNHSCTPHEWVRAHQELTLDTHIYILFEIE